jgi:hypothetical protein
MSNQHVFTPLDWKNSMLALPLSCRIVAEKVTEFVDEFVYEA